MIAAMPPNAVLRLLQDRWLQVSEHRTGSGGTVILQTDVTEIMREERNERDRLLDRQARVVRATLDHLNQGVCIFDGAQRLAGWNRKAFDILGVAGPERVQGMSFARLLDAIVRGHRFNEGLSSTQVAAWAASERARTPLAFELQGPPDRTIAVFAREMPDRGFVISFTDVTSERQAAKALFDMNERLERRVEERTLELEDALAEAERANASKTRFVAAASHDLMQPLSAAKLFVASMADQTVDPAVQAIATKAEGALAGAQDIIETLLDISRLESRSVTFDRRRVRLQDILMPLLDEFEPMARQKSLDLRVVPSDLWVLSDPTYLRRILQNLIGNAVRYTVTGRILVGVRRNGGSARLEVWDTGPGIAEEDQRTIFEEFRQAPGTRSPGQGLGLGLAIVERACSALGHPLSLWSRPGSGSCFSLNVPIVDAHAAPEAPEASLREPQVDLRGLLVLLVENDDALGRAISMMIEGWGGYVIHAGSAGEALSLLTEIEVVPDAFLLDYQLGEQLTGLDLWATLRERHGPMPVRLISANRTRELRDSCAAAGAPLLTKPLDRTALAQFLISARDG